MGTSSSSAHTGSSEQVPSTKSVVQDFQTILDGITAEELSEIMVRQ